MSSLSFVEYQMIHLERNNIRKLPEMQNPKENDNNQKKQYQQQVSASTAEYLSTSSIPVTVIPGVVLEAHWS